MNRVEFVQSLSKRGATADQIKEALSLRRQKIGAFDDDPKQTTEPYTQEPKAGLIESAVNFVKKLPGDVVTSFKQPGDAIAGAGKGALLSLPTTSEKIPKAMPGTMGASAADYPQDEISIEENSLAPLQPKNKAQESGGRLLTAAQLFTPFLGGASGMASKTLKSVASTAEKIGKTKLSAAATKISSELSGISEDALVHASTKGGREELKKAFGTANEVGKKVLNLVKEPWDYLEEIPVVKEALNAMPHIEMKNVYKALDDASIAPLSKPAIKANNYLSELKGIYINASKKGKDVDVYNVNSDVAKAGAEKTIEQIRFGFKELPPPKRAALPGPGQLSVDSRQNSLSTEVRSALGGLKETVQVDGYMSASTFFEARKQLDNVLKDAYAKDPGAAGLLEKKLFQVRAVMKEALEESAQRSGNTAYVNAMNSLSTKLDAISRARAVFSRNSINGELNAESVMRNIFNKGKTERLEAIKAIEDIFGDDFVKQAKLAQMADQLGDKGVASLLPRQVTGRSSLGMGYKLPLSSPKIFTEYTLPSIKKTENKITATMNKTIPFLKTTGKVTEAASGLKNKATDINALLAANKIFQDREKRK